MVDRLAGDRAGRLVDRVVGQVSEHRGPGSQDPPVGVRPGVRVERLLLRPGGVLGVVLDWPDAEDAPDGDARAGAVLALYPDHPDDHGAEHPADGAGEGDHSVPVARIELRRWDSVSDPGSHDDGGRWTGSGTVEVGAGAFRLVVSVGGRRSELPWPETDAVLRTRSIGPTDLTLSIEPGPERQAVLRVQPSPPTAVVRRVRALRVPLEVDVTLPEGWSVSTTRFELKQRRGGGARPCLVRPSTGTDGTGTTDAAEADADRHATVSIDALDLLTRDAPGASGASGSSVWDLWVASDAGRLRVGRRDTDLTSLRTAHSWGWSGAPGARTGADHPDGPAGPDGAGESGEPGGAEIRPYFTDSFDFAVEVRPASTNQDHPVIPELDRAVGAA